MTDLSRLAEEIILWTTKEFSFAEISDKHASTSSMMPQKKNAIVPEVFRARTSQVLGDLVGAMGLVKALPLSYNLDLQELTRNLWSALDKTTTSVEIIAEVVNAMKFNTKRLLEATSSDDFLYATELADHLVRKFRLPFREAHGRVGKLAKYCSTKSGRFSDLSSKEIVGDTWSRTPTERYCFNHGPDKDAAQKKCDGLAKPEIGFFRFEEKIAGNHKARKDIILLAKELDGVSKTALAFCGYG